MKTLLQFKSKFLA